MSVTQSSHYGTLEKITWKFQQQDLEDAVRKYLMAEWHLKPEWQWNIAFEWSDSEDFQIGLNVVLRIEDLPKVTE